jgi:radical SAM protein with 4Fe4S-binding SPASM domain
VFDVAKLLCDHAQPLGSLRYEAEPTVVWFRDGTPAGKPDLGPEQGRALIDDLASSSVRALLLADRDGLNDATLELAAYARTCGIRIRLAIGVAPLDSRHAQHIRNIGVALVTVVPGDDVEAARINLHALRAAGQSSELEVTLTSHVLTNLAAIFAFIEQQDVERVAFRHVVPEGPDEPIADRAAVREALETIFRYTRDLDERGDPRAIVTTANHADPAFAWLVLQRMGSPLAYRAQRFIEWSGAATNAVHADVASVERDGAVHPDRYLRAVSIGSVRERPLSSIWSDDASGVLAKLFDRRRHVDGRCAGCRFLGICGGNIRARALAMTGDLWASDPGCYLTDQEIAPAG